jgi:bis(5'-nucleosyl)-tetraphosphatase (symmetrical)
MSTYAIGDLQGCLASFETLLARLPDPQRLIFVGDVVNRGPQSLVTLREVRRRVRSGDAVALLGNHDLHLLAVDAGIRPLHRSDTLQDILDAPDRRELIDWLRTLPLAHADAGRLFVHAGVPPQWTAAGTIERSEEVRARLRRDDYRDFLQRMYGNQPDQWRDDLEGADRLRFITNAFTRLRVCDREGRLLLKFKGTPDSMPPGALPWFRVPGRLSSGARMVCGHWSALGYLDEEGVLALDTGGVWGGSLTAQRIDRTSTPVSVPNRSGALPIDGA